MKATSTTTEVASSVQTTHRATDTLSSDPTFSAVSSVAIMLALGAAIASYISPKARQPSANVRSDSKVMCHSCKYFHNNLYLNCTLHPSSVMTERAVDCKDYCPNHQTQRVKAWKKFVPFIGKIFPD
jgi:hypothetical protein